MSLYDKKTSRLNQYVASYDTAQLRESDDDYTALFISFTFVTIIITNELLSPISSVKYKLYKCYGYDYGYSEVPII